MLGAACHIRARVVVSVQAMDLPTNDSISAVPGVAAGASTLGGAGTPDSPQFTRSEAFAGYDWSWCEAGFA